MKNFINQSLSREDAEQGIYAKHVKARKTCVQLLTIHQERYVSYLVFIIKALSLPSTV